MSNGEWMANWNQAEAFSLRIAAICAAMPLMVESWSPNDRIARVGAAMSRDLRTRSSASHAAGAAGAPTTELPSSRQPRAPSATTFPDRRHAGPATLTLGVLGGIPQTPAPGWLYTSFEKTTNP